VLTHAQKGRKAGKMFEFAVKGSVVGFNPSADGTKCYVKIQPVNPPNLQRDERAGLVDMIVPAAAVKSLAVNAVVLVRGKCTSFVKDWRNPQTGKQKAIKDFRFEAETIDPAK